MATIAQIHLTVNVKYHTLVARFRTLNRDFTLNRDSLNRDFTVYCMQGLEGVNESIKALHSGSCLRAVVHITPPALKPQAVDLPALKGNVKFESGRMKQMSHFSEVNNCQMTFSIYLPDRVKRNECDPPVLYYLSGLTCSDENARTKAHFAEAAAKYGLAVVFPDTSPRGVDIPGQDESYDFGSGAGFYVDATQEPWAKHYKMYSYVTRELPQLVNSLFPVDGSRMSITGHSMGGHGAITIFLKNPGAYRQLFLNHHLFLGLF